MRYVIMLTLDAETTQTIEAATRAIANVHPLHRPFDGEVGPHVTLAACNVLDLDRVGSVLEAMWAEGPPPLRFESLGVFLPESSVVFAAPVVTRELLTLHERTHRALEGIAQDHALLYLPGAWVPHCTLAERVPGPLLPEVVRAASALPLPLAGRIAAIQVAAFPAARVVRAVPLSG